MARVKHSAVVSAVSGQIKKQEFYVVGGATLVKGQKKSPRTFSKSFSQNSGKIPLFAKYWNDLTEAQRQFWYDVVAKEKPTETRRGIGGSYALSARQLYTRIMFFQYEINSAVKQPVIVAVNKGIPSFMKVDINLALNNVFFIGDRPVNQNFIARLFYSNKKNLSVDEVIKHADVVRTSIIINSYGINYGKSFTDDMGITNKSQYGTFGYKIYDYLGRYMSKGIAGGDRF